MIWKWIASWSSLGKILENIHMVYITNASKYIMVFLASKYKMMSFHVLSIWTCVNTISVSKVKLCRSFLVTRIINYAPSIRIQNWHHLLNCRIKSNLPLYSRNLWTAWAAFPSGEGCPREGFHWTVAKAWGACLWSSEPSIVLPPGLPLVWWRHEWHRQREEKAGRSPGGLRAKAWRERVPCWEQVHSCWPCSPTKHSSHSDIRQVRLPVWLKEERAEVVEYYLFPRFLAAGGEGYADCGGAEPNRRTWARAAGAAVVVGDRTTANIWPPHLAHGPSTADRHRVTNNTGSTTQRWCCSILVVYSSTGTATSSCRNNLSCT